MNIFSAKLNLLKSDKATTSKWSEPITLPQPQNAVDYTHIGIDGRCIYSDTSAFCTKGAPTGWVMSSNSPITSNGKYAKYDDYGVDNAVVYNQSSNKSYLYTEVTSSYIETGVQVGSSNEIFDEICFSAGARVLISSTRALVSLSTGFGTYSSFSEISGTGLQAVSKVAILYRDNEDVNDKILAIGGGQATVGEIAINSSYVASIDWGSPKNLPFAYVTQLFTSDDKFIICGTDNQYGYVKYLSYSSDGENWSEPLELFDGTSGECQGYVYADYKHVIVGYKNTGTLIDPHYVGYIKTSFDLINWRTETKDGLQLVDVGYFVDSTETNKLMAITPKQLIQAEWEH